MPISVTQGPGPINWTKNTINVTFSYSLMTIGWKLEIRIRDLVTGVVITTVQYPFNGTSGSMTVDLRQLYDPYPVLQKPANLTTVVSDVSQDISQQVKRVYFDFRPVGTGAPTTYTFGPNFYIIKGGMGEMTLNDVLVNNNVSLDVAKFLPYSSKFLTWIPPLRKMTPNEWGWLTYLSTTDPGVQFVRYTVKYRTGATQTFNKNLTGSAGSGNLYKLWLIPIGVHQAKLDNFNTGVQYIDVSIMTGSTVLQAAYRIFVDNRAYYKTLNVFYRNSFGGIDHLHLKGNIAPETSARKEDAQIIEFQPMFYSKGRPSWKGNSGWITKGQANALFELVNTTEAYLIQNGELLPVRIPPQTLGWKTKDDLLATDLLVEAAAEFETMPKQVATLL